jgi:expansin (peptidoglycan-binding protein)
MRSPARGWQSNALALLSLVAMGANVGCSDGGGGGGGPVGDASLTDSTAPGVDTGAPGNDTGVPAEIGPPPDAGPLVTYGQPYTGGQFHLGPVDWTETQFHNACASDPNYDTRVRTAEGVYLAGIWNGIPNVAGYCDACITVTTAKGKSAILRVVTYGDTTSNSIDVSPEAYAILDSGEYPRAMTWQFARCPDTGVMMYEFKATSSEWWAALWVRNARVPLSKVEVKSVSHPTWFALTRESDGSLSSGSTGFGKGAFSIRSTGVDGQTVTEDFAWPAAGLDHQFLVGTSNFK